MISIQDILKDKFDQYQKNPIEASQLHGLEYGKKWNEAVQFFQIRINKDRKKDKKLPIPFIAVRMKLVALREIDDLRWFYRECVRYATTYQENRINGRPIRNTFSRCFYGALKIK